MNKLTIRDEKTAAQAIEVMAQAMILSSRNQRVDKIQAALFPFVAGLELAMEQPEYASMLYKLIRPHWDGSAVSESFVANFPIEIAP